MKVSNNKPLPSLQSERDKQKMIRRKQEEYQSIVKKFDKVRQSKSRTREKDDPKTPTSMLKSPDNPYKRASKVSSQEFYNSEERKKRLENRRNRNSNQKESTAKKSRISDISEHMDSSGVQNLNFNPDGRGGTQAQKVNIDLFNKDFSQDANTQIKKSQPKIVEIPVFHEDFEEITQTIENGVVVEEFKRTIKSPISKTPNTVQSQDVSFNIANTDINENFETKDIDEEEKCINSKVQAHYLKAKKKKLFCDYKDTFLNQEKTLFNAGDLSNRSG